MFWLTAFICQEKGIFENTDSNDCTTFIYCDSNLTPQVNDCGDNTYFWPAKKGCFSDFNCAAQSIPDNINPCEGFTSNERIPDKYSIDCSTYLQCSKRYVYDQIEFTYIEIPKVSRSVCTSGSVFRPRYGCVSASDYACNNYQCDVEGNFANTNVDDCSTFIKCAKFFAYNGGGAFISYPTLKTCPANTNFSPFSNSCDEFYNCDAIDPHAGIGDPCLNYNWASPYVPNPHDNDCSSYLECQQGTYDDQIRVIVKKECPAATLFSPIVGKCYYNHDCNQSCSKDPCSNGVGKFVDYKSGQCENFIECRDTSQAQLIYRPVYEKVYCPPGTLFSPETFDCDREYVCPKFPVNYCYPDIPTTPPPTTTTMAPAAA